MKNKIAYLRMILALIRISRNPEHTESVFVMGESLYKMGASDVALQKLAQSPEALEIIKNRKLLGSYDLHELQKLPPGTLGKSYADHMIRLNLDPNFYPFMKMNNDTAYVIMRVRQTHDLWHVMTGFDTSIPGEIGLQAFMAAQTSLPTSFILLAGSLFKAAVNHPSIIDTLMENIIKGWQLGKKAKLIFGLDWEANWNVPLEDLRRQYQILE
jgi:ubiquinone biosynthesis protein Coq4